MPAQPFMLDPTRLHLLALSADSTSITVQMQTCSDSASCPQCGCRSALGRHTDPSTTLVPSLLL
jgi:hypothetical protein